MDIWAVWDLDAIAVAVRASHDFDEVRAARTRAMVRDMRMLRARTKQYKRVVEQARRGGDFETLTTAKKLRDMCRRIVNDCKLQVSEVVDRESVMDSKTRPRDGLASYSYDAYNHRMRQQSVVVSDEFRDAAFPPILDYPEVALLLPDLSKPR